jgi:hypothetical protein
MVGGADFVQKAVHTLPYLPPYISIRNHWMEPNEIIAPIRHGQSPGLPIAAASGFPTWWNDSTNFMTLGL